MRLTLEIIFWFAAAALIYTQVGYALLLRAFAPLRKTVAAPRLDAEQLPPVSLVIAAYNEQAVIAEKVRNAHALDYPGRLLQVIVACDGCTDQTAEEARQAGANEVLELDRGGKIGAQNAAVKVATGEVLAFSDANSHWRRDALKLLVARLATTPQGKPTGYVCGQVRFERSDGTNQEGLYWRFEMWIRSLESRLRSITAGNGAIYAVPRDRYVELDPLLGPDIVLPFTTVKAGAAALYEPRARATEQMVPTNEGEFKRKRRMMTRSWPALLKAGMLSFRGYSPSYAWMIISHRLLRYLSPFLHLLALAANVALVALYGEPLYWVTLALQLALILAAVLGNFVRFKPLLIANYYVGTTAALALGLWDWLRHGTQLGWEAPEGTR